MTLSDRSASHYETLELRPSATQSEVKQAYRRLAKRYHPDSNGGTGDRDKILSVNAAYAVLGNPQQRRRYDAQLLGAATHPSAALRQERSARAQTHHQQQRQSGRDADSLLQEWLQAVYAPVNRSICSILNPLEVQLDCLSADPFDDGLLAAFEGYLTDCRNRLADARRTLSLRPNPSEAAAAAANLYYCLNQIEGGIDELAWFPYNFNEQYLHAGKELFRIARSLQDDARTLPQVAR
ncbi:DnaJ-class molecular chaperone with C-terminal Zn finger domain protein [Rubidibacter lacunae KORDI 51-2]|uniref:DnaJ-class molecular chaperone with C-terminal Zn finger domain protein n=1 Tax=Rubidibacter lacunae KORDI 51-2 TaxID=582515 RepID=U5DPT1_9CHRO|nr:J domain-containing protein [Rubidibacter lacunae]ERN42594.1 DnaJ-class molecular chaperone with C-terminal Zn finger domain protein [Rubidibacter lacunae KORDI 51-2]